MIASPDITRLDDFPLERRPLLWLLASQALAVAPFMLHGPVWVPLSCLATLALRAIILQRGLRLPPRWLLVAILGLATAAVLAEFGTLIGRDAGTALLILLLGLKQFETRALRDAVVGVMLGYLALAALFLFTQSIPITLYALGCAALLTAALAALNPGSGTRGLRSELGLALRLALHSLPFVLALFLLFPRIEGPLWRTPMDEASGRTGLSDEMSPGEISNLIRSTRTAFRVSFEGPIPVEAQRYWRGPVLWSFDGRTWRMPERLIERLPRNSPDSLQGPVDYTVTLEPHGRRWVFPLDLPAQAPSGLRLTADYQLRVREPIREVRQFRLRSYIDYELAADLHPRERELALQLPPGHAPGARELGRSWRAALRSDSAIVRRALEHFAQNPFSYTLSPRALHDDPVDQFLFETREGFCEHYAGAFVVLMRAAGIPARVVTGYQGGEYNPMGDYLLVRQADAHAWAEVWLRGSGWLRVDPTAAVSPDRIDLGIEAALSGQAELPVALGSGRVGDWLRGLRLAWDSVNFYWNDWVLAYGPERQRRLLEYLGWRHLDAMALIATLIGVVLLLGLAYTGFELWRRRVPAPEPSLRLYRRFCARLARIGLRRHPWEGPLDFARRVGGRRPDLSAQIQTITKLYARLRYGSGDTETLERLTALVRDFRPPKKEPAEAG